MNSTLAIVGIAISLLTSVIAVTAVIVQMKTNVTSLGENDRKHAEREEKAAREVTELLVLLKSFISAQTEINKTVEMGLTGVVTKLQEMEKRTVEASTVVSLLTEVLKRKPGVAIEP